MSSEQPTPEELKEKGNEAVKNGRYPESILHYTHAIKLDPNNSTLYSNRSYAFLKTNMYHFAMEDANKTITLKPDWPKGYFRKAEIEFATYNFSDALLSYYLAFKLKPDDETIKSAILKTNLEIEKGKRGDVQIPWLGAGVGIIIGVAVVIADLTLPEKPSLSHPILMVLLTIAIAALGYFIAKGIRYQIKSQRATLLEPPPDLDPNEKTENETNNGEKQPNEKVGHKYTKGQTRQRYKRGKT